MLVVSRRVGQSLMIGEDVEVVILRVDRSEIRIGIKAPRSVPVLRKELVEREQSPASAQPPASHGSHRVAAA